ncbi:hypothetical protein L6452_28984 [Arctium lappa]|uniref:Uncharacterized protein n=1 Tax=Arctium lappa TaxID=4217 RepID=A0ACB8ZEZ4_ARCLA|nr:hypothetical protein L6452_28984 [Arctium lappa]
MLKNRNTKKSHLQNPKGEAIFTSSFPFVLQFCKVKNIYIFRLPSIMLKTINIAYAFTLITSSYFLDGVVGKGVLTLKATGIDATLLTSKIESNRTIIVDIHGPEELRSIQDAINSIPDGNQNWVIIHVKKGIYREKVTIPREKTHIFLRGSGMTKTAIVWSQSSENNYESSTFKVEAPNFVAYGISFKNEAPTGIANTSHNQSVAAYVGADKVAFYSCGFYSNHNTLLDNKGRHYYDGCYIQGSIDVIFGRARSIFHDCEIFVIMDNRMEILGSVTAHTRTSISENTGFVFIRGKVYGIAHAFLGRPKGDHSRVVFANTYMSKTVRPEGWSKWNHNGNLENIYHAEYGCYGPGSATDNRAHWLKKLNDEEAAPFLSMNFIDGRQWTFQGKQFGDLQSFVFGVKAIMEGGDEGIERVEDSKDLQQQSKALDKLTDHVEDRQLDSTRVQEAMASIAASKEADLNAMRLREKELAAVKINAAEVDIIANELELDKKVAERTLREHKGDAVAAIRHLLHVGNL